MTSPPSGLRDVAHRRLADTLRHLQRYATYTAGSGIEDSDGILLVAGAHSHPHPYVNAALRTDPATDPREMLRRARRFFSERDRGFVLWIADRADDDLEASAIADGFVQRAPLDGTPEMMLDARPALADPPPGVKTRRVADEHDAAAFALVVADAYAHAVPPDVSRAIFADSAILLAPDAAAFTAWAGDEPVAAALVLFGAEAAEIGFVATLDRVRGRGLGTLITAAAAREGFERGSRVVFLQASAMGEPVYLRMGFRELLRYRRYDSPGA